jgi:DNA primase
MFEHAQAYFAKVLPWPQEGDPPAYINIHWKLKTVSERTGKPIWSGRAVRSVNEAVATVKWAMTLSDVEDIYVCMSSQKEALEKVSKKGIPYVLPIRSQDNADKLKSLFIDLDAKGEALNSYANVNDAAAALNDFIAKAGLPKPSVIVTSGGGLHVYWTFASALTPTEWQPLANALAEATKAHGLKCDTGCTIDSARILRVPDTLNRKLDVSRPVGLVGGRTGSDYSVERLETALAPFKVAVPVKALSPFDGFPRKPPIEEASDLEMGIESFPLVDLDIVATECSFINQAITTGGKDFANPLWNLTTLISTFTEGGRADAHRMGSSHSSYDQAATDELFDRKERERQSKGLGWPACRTISASGHQGCQACVHFATNRSPLHAATTKLMAKVSAQTPPPNGNQGVNGTSVSNDDLPAGFKRLQNNIVCRIMIDNDGSTSDWPLSSYPMYNPTLQVSPQQTLNFTTNTELGRATRIALPLKEASTKEGMIRLLWNQGMPIRDGEAKNIREFVVSWIEKLQRSKQAVVSSSPFGWSEDHTGNLEGFVFGGSLWMPNNLDRGAANPDPVLVKRFRPMGEKDHWIKAAKMITDQDRPALDAILASAFAAPLLRFVNLPGILLSTYSTESGVGKTTAMRIAQAVWGNPHTAMAGTTDTSNSVFGKMGQINSLPIYWDELKGEDESKRFVKMVFDLVKGREKDRMTQNANMKEAGSWRTMMISASNDSIMDHVAQNSKNTAAGIYRVFEYAVPHNKTGKGQISSALADKIHGVLDQNHGVVGMEYAQFLGRNFATIETEVFALNEELSKEFGMANEERFWRVMIVTLLKGAEYANMLKFTNIDLVRMKKFLAAVLDNMRGDRKASHVDMSDAFNVVNVLAQFLNDRRARHTLRTNRVHVGRGKPAAGTIEIKTMHPERLDAIQVHIGVQDKVVRISKTFLTQWLQEHGYSIHIMMKSLAAELGAITVPARIASGTDYAGASEYLLEINLAGTPHANFIDEA